MDGEKHCLVDAKLFIPESITSSFSSNSRCTEIPAIWWDQNALFHHNKLRCANQGSGPIILATLRSVTFFRAVALSLSSTRLRSWSVCCWSSGSSRNGEATLCNVKLAPFIPPWFGLRCASKFPDESQVVRRGIPVLGSNMWTLAKVSSNADCFLVAVSYFSQSWPTSFH